MRCRVIISIAALTVLSNTAQAVRNGDAAGALDRPRNILHGRIIASPTRTEFLTAGNVVYDRCLLTAGHTLPTDLTTLSFYEGLDLRTPGAGDPKQSVATVQTRSATPGWLDLSVVWLDNYQDVAMGQTRIQAGRDYVPLLLARPETLDMSAVEHSYGPDMARSAPNPLVDIIGYGMNTTTAGVDSGVGVKRKGRVGLYQWAPGTAQATPRTGSQILALGMRNGPIGCAGDSGAPLIVSDRVLGTLTGTRADDDPQTCSIIRAHLYAGLENTAPAGQVSNWAWVNKAVQTTCRKTVDITVTGSGTVAGTTMPAPTITDGAALNGAINCGTDCREYVHQNERLSVTATPAAGWRFAGWTSCPPCTGQGATCLMAFNNIGTYSPTVSNDTTACGATFERVMGCGDNHLDSGEQCDDGNLTNGDGCNASCETEIAATCGDGILHASEQCDDANVTSGDGCSSSCTLESPYSPACGNSILDSDEACDDGNTSNGDGCSSTCKIELSGGICGDGTLNLHEECDDGNATNGDGCSSSCAIEWDLPLCGNGTIDSGTSEECDDGNNANLDGCNQYCKNEYSSPTPGPGPSPSPAPGPAPGPSPAPSPSPAPEAPAPPAPPMPAP